MNQAPASIAPPAASVCSGPRVRVKAGTTLFQPEQECQGFVIVHKGTIRVSLTAENGREIILYRVQPGEICLQTFGCLVENRAYSAEGVAETDVELEQMSRAAFFDRITSDPSFRDQIFTAVAHRFSDLEQLVEDVALTGFEARLARALLRLMDPARRVSTTHETLAAEVGSGRAVVSRQLGHFARDGVVALTRGRIDIVDEKRLRDIAASEM